MAICLVAAQEKVNYFFFVETQQQLEMPAKHTRIKEVQIPLLELKEKLFLG